MKTTLAPCACTSENPISRVNFSRIKRELHASPKHGNAFSLAIFTGIAFANGSSMKTTIRNLLAATLLVAMSLKIHAQGSLVYDQQSYPTPINPVGNGNVDGLDLSDEPLEQFTQSFIPSLSAIDFVALEFESANVPATVKVNLYDSVNVSVAALLATTTPVTMPGGFVNNGLGVAGVEYFYFSTPITLTPGDIYYLEPTLVSGGAQWAFVTIVGDAYPNGELNVNGHPFVNPTDMWFQEGVVAVPEPATLPLTAVACIVAYIFRGRLKRPKLPVLMFAGALFTLPVLSVHASQDSIVQATADAAGLTPVSTTAPIGTFWVATVDPNGGLTTLPYPSLSTNMMDLPTYLVTNDIYIVDDTKGELSSSSTGQVMSSADASSVAQEQSQTVANLIDMIDNPHVPSTNGDTGDVIGYPLFQADGLPAIFDTTNAWIEATNESPNLGLLLENAIGGDNYQLLSTTNLLIPSTNWYLGQILTGVSAGENDFNPVPYTNSMMFFRVHQANPIMEVYNTQNAIEPDPTNSDPGQVGKFLIQNEYSGTTSNVTVRYTISGTAQNGIDYSNIPDSVIVSNSLGFAQINIDPIADGLKPNQTIILTLNPNANYLIDPANDSNTNTITANPQVYPTVNGDTEFPCPNSSLSFFLQAQDPRNLTLVYTLDTLPTHGTLITNSLQSGSVTYTSSGCFEGQDSFTFSVSDGQYSAGPATISLDVSDPLTSTPLSIQTCRGTPISFSLPVSDRCSETLGNYILLSSPANGTLSNTPNTLNFTFTPDGTNFTGTNGFSYIAFSACGDDSTTNSVSIVIGDENVQAGSQSYMTGTNRPITFTLPTSDSDSCNDSNDYTYTIVTPPADGTLSGTGADRTYTPNLNFEGEDTFEFAVSDGSWINNTNTVAIYVVGAPTLYATCDPFGPAVLLNWSLDTTVSNLYYQQGLGFQDYVLSRSANSGGPFAPIYTSSEIGLPYYWDTNTTIGQAYYYEMNFEANESGIVYESPQSNIAGASSQTNNHFIPANAFWEVVTNLADPTHSTVRRQMPMSSQFEIGQSYPFLYPPPNSDWTSSTTWSNYTTFVIPTNTPMTNVQYSIGIDNVSILFVNGVDVGTNNNNGTFALWSPFVECPTNVLHFGTNNVGVQVTDFGDFNYFSMVVTTNTCGY